MFNKLQTKRGVTLVELMVVVVLIGVLAAIASPGISRALDRQNAAATAAEVASALRTARNQAMSRGTPVWVTFTTATAANKRGEVSLTTQGTVAAGDVARSCREYDNAKQKQVGYFTPNTLAGEGGIVRAEPTEICFSPDGRVLQRTGGLLNPVAARCAWDYGMVYTADWNATLDSAKHLECPASVTAKKAQRDQRAIIRMNEIALPFNGAIRVEQ